MSSRLPVCRFSLLHRVDRALIHCHSSFAIVFLMVLLECLTSLAQSPIETIDTSIPGSQVDSHPYAIIVDEETMIAYATICGDVAPFGEPVENHSNNKVIEFDARSLQVLRVFTVGYYPTELILAHGDLWVTCSTSNQLYRIDLDGNEHLSIALTDSSGAPISYPSGIAVGSTGEIYVASNGGSFDGSDENVVSIDPVTNQISQRYSIAGAISVLACLDDGSLLIPVGFPGDDFTAAPIVYWIDPLDGAVLSMLDIDVDTTDFPGPSDLEILQDNTALLTLFGGSSEVFRIDLDTRLMHSTYPIPGADTVQTAVTADTDDSFIVAHFFAGHLSRIQLDNGDLIGDLEGLDFPNRIAIGGGRVFSTNQGAESISVHAAVGAFLRADINIDGVIDMADPIGLLQYLFLGIELLCHDAGDIGDDGVLDISDPIQLLNYLFSQGPTPAYPFPVAGSDLTDDALDCGGVTE
ncbi:MAG: hypothetical protein AAEJ47_03880 [Planctomycetota bacterium]